MNFQVKSTHLIQFKSNNKRFLINIKCKNCSCYDYCKFAVCSHLVSASQFFGKQKEESFLQSHKKFVKKTKKGRPAKAKSALYKD